jgi:hypothetical protein
MRLESVKSFKRRAMGDRTHGPFILGPSGVFLTALFYFSADPLARRE